MFLTRACETKMNEEAVGFGYVYVLTNKSFRDDWVKIGYSSRIPDIRSKELDNTAVPLPYEVYATLKTKKYKEAESLIHSFIRKLNPTLRIRESREFFNIKPEDAANILEDVAGVLDESEVEYWSEGKKVIDEDPSGVSPGKKSRKLGKWFTFFSKGLNIGETITFIDDAEITATVSDEKEVAFEGKKWKLSPLAYEIFKRKNQLNSSGAYQGAHYFRYQGTRLSDLPDVLTVESKGQPNHNDRGFA
jgi:hypothetical protein